jgi:hypothetical protein
MRHHTQGATMNRLIILLTLALTPNAFALGPIPNGTYSGSENCTGYSPIPSTLVITDSTVKWDDQTLAFDADINGFFKMHTLDGMNGTGMGHFTKDGLHYEVTFDMPMDNGKIVPVPGEDTFTYSQGVLQLSASASMTSGGIMACSGTFTKAP